MKRTILLMLLILSTFCYAQESMLADITESVETDFGTYVPYLVEIEPDAAQYEIESDFSNVVNFNDFNFTEAQKAKLLQNHFVVIPGREYTASGYKEIYDIYNEARENDVPQFITTDAVLHTYHKLYDKILMTAEEDYFIQFLTQMDSLLLKKGSFSFRVGKYHLNVSYAGLIFPKSNFPVIKKAIILKFFELL